MLKTLEGAEYELFESFQLAQALYEARCRKPMAALRRRRCR